MCFDTGNENGGGGQKAHNLCTNFQCKTVPLSTVCVDKLVHQFATQNCVPNISRENCVPNITEDQAEECTEAGKLIHHLFPKCQTLRGRFEDPD